MKFNYSKKETKMNGTVTEENISVELSVGEILSVSDKFAEMIKDKGLVSVIKELNTFGQVIDKPNSTHSIDKYFSKNID